MPQPPGSFAPSRRHVTAGLLQLLGGAALAGALPSAANAAREFACKPDIRQASGDAVADFVRSVPLIDTHVHIFNASDIPAYQWLYDVTVPQLAADFGVSEVTAQGLVRDSIDALIGKQQKRVSVAPGFAQEYVFLRYLERNDRFAKYQAKSRTGLRSALSTEFYTDYLKALLESLKARGEQDFQWQNRKYLRVLCAVYGRNFDDLVKPGTAELGYLARQLAKQSDEGLRLFTPAETAEQNRNQGSRVRRFLSCQPRLRIENAIIMNALFEIDGGEDQRLALTTPALLDIRYWLDARRHSNCAVDGSMINPDSFTCEDASQANQTRLMRSLSVLYEGRLHAFVGYCPWRHVDVEQRPKTAEAREGHPLRDVGAKAINERGLIGFKLYPPMGFRAIGNAAFDKNGQHPEPLKNADFKVYSKRFGVLIDEALLHFYEFCIDNDVPIMAHCGFSNASWIGPRGKHQSFAQRASPQYWLNLLSGNFDHPNAELAARVKSKIARLRLNLSHFAFLGEGLKETGKDPKDDWATPMKALLSSYPNTYADIAYIVAPLTSRNAGNPCADADKWFAFMKAFLTPAAGTAPAYPLWQKLMYGSDWYMSAQEKFHWNSLNVFASRWVDVVPDGVDKGRAVAAFVSGNAIRYLGLEPPATPGAAGTHTRLTAFYNSRDNMSEAAASRALKCLDDYAAAASRIFTA